MRPREQYLATGPTSLGDTQLLALLLGTGTPSTSVEELAHRLLTQHGGIHGLMRVDPGELLQSEGVGIARAVRIHAGLALGRRAIMRQRTLTATVSTPEQAYALFEPRLTLNRSEELHGLFLDARSRIVGLRTLSQGNDAFTIVDPRQVFRVALATGARSVVLAHNHPSGDPTPSIQDQRVTERVAAAGRVIGIPLVDHLIIADGQFSSMAQLGLLPDWVSNSAPPMAC
jgi:DNA repair protein RadC